MSRYYGDGIVDVSFVEVGKLVVMCLKSGSLFSITFHSNAFTITVEQKNINKWINKGLSLVESTLINPVNDAQKST